MKNRTLHLTLAGVALALCLVLPFLTGQIPRFGQLLSPMHLPVLICGLICGPYYGAVVGLIAPLLRSGLFSMPPLFPTATAMAVELGVYGLLAGCFRRVFPPKRSFLLPSLIGAMLGGRVAGGLTQWLFFTFGWIESYSLSLFLSAYIIASLPGILLQLIIIPPVVILLEKHSQKTQLKK